MHAVLLDPLRAEQIVRRMTISVLAFGVGGYLLARLRGRGFEALAAIIVADWRPFRVLGAALLFGVSTALAFRLSAYSVSVATLLQALPYALTLIAVTGLSGRSRAAERRPYVRS